MGKPYNELGTRSQTAGLLPIARDILGDYGLTGASVRTLNHGFNTTYSVTARDGNRYALRLNVNSIRTPEEICAEVSWVQALHAEGMVQVARPIETRAGELLARREWEELPRPLYAVLYSWLPGAIGWKAASPVVAKALGAASAELHRNAAHWTMPKGAALRKMPDVLFGHRFRFDTSELNLDMGVFRETFRRGEEVLNKLKRTPTRPIHFDLHLGNVKWHRNKLFLFDFDDSILGWPILDAAVSAFYLRRLPEWRDLEAAYRKGIGSIEDPANLRASEFETLVACRGLFLVNELFGMNTASLLAMAPGYAVLTEKRLKHFLRTGVFDPHAVNV